MAPITTDTFIENPTALLPVSDSPELARFMAEAKGTSDPHPGGGGAAGVSGRRSLNRAYVSAAGFGYQSDQPAEVVAAAEGETTLVITTTVRTADGEPPAAPDVADDMVVHWEVATPGDFVGAPGYMLLSRQGEMDLVSPETIGTHRVYHAEVPIEKPLTAEQVSLRCAEAVDQMSKWGTGISIVDVVLDLAGYYFTGPAYPIMEKALKGIGTAVGLSGLGTALSSGSAVECVTLGQRRTQALEEDWVVGSVVAGVFKGRQWDLPGQRMCGRHPDVFSRSVGTTYSGNEIIAGSELIVENEIILPMLLEARIDGPDSHAVGEEVTFFAVGAGGSGGHEFYWNNVTKGPSFRHTATAVEPYELVLAVRDSTGDTACQSKTIEVTDAASDEPADESPAAPEALHLSGGITLTAAQEQELETIGLYYEGSSIELTFPVGGGALTGSFSSDLVTQGIESVNDASMLSEGERSLLLAAMNNGACDSRVQSAGSVTGTFDAGPGAVSGTVNVTARVTFSGCGSPEIDAKLGNTRADSLQLSGTFVNGSVTGTLTRAGSSLPFEAHQFE
jgi:hypothetical protein